MWELDHKEGWVTKDWRFWSVVLEKTLESTLDCKEIKPINPERNQSWIFIGRIDAEAEAPNLWPPDMKNWLIGKDPDAGKDWRRRGWQRMMMVGWHHWLNGHESEQALGDSEGQGNLACCSPWGCKESNMTKWLNYNNGYMLSINILLQNISLFRAEVCLIKTIISFVSLYVKGPFDIILCNEDTVGSR